MKKIFIIGALSFFCLSLVNVSAQETERERSGLLGTIDRAENARETIEERSREVEQRINSDRETREVPAQREAPRENRIETREEIRNTASERLENFQSRVQNLREERTSRVEEKKAKLEEKQKERLTRIVNNIFGKFDRLLGVIGSMSERLEKRINEFELRGVNLSESKRLLGEADNNLSLAKTEIQEIKDTVLDLIENQEVGKETLRRHLLSGQEILKDLRASYVAVITSIKGELPNNQEVEDEEETEDSETENQE